MNYAPTILIAVPLFEGWEHVGETLQSIKLQTYRNFRVLISVDGGDRRSYAACQPHLDDERFEIVLQDKRLFWEGNVNWLAGQLREDYFCYWQHDDYCDPTYLQKLVDHAVRHPEGSSVYCDMQLMDTMEGLIQHPSTLGFALQRILQQVDHFNPAVIRCLIRADALRYSLPIKMVFTWGMSLARVGELHRLPELLYFRRIRAKGLTYTLLERPPKVLWQQSLEFALGVIQNAYPLVPAEERVRLFGFAVDRLINRRLYRKWLYDFGKADQQIRLRFVREFLAETYARFGWQPFTGPEGSDPIANLRARRQRAGLFEGEDLIIEALLADLEETSRRPVVATGEIKSVDQDDVQSADKAHAPDPFGKQVIARLRMMLGAMLPPGRSR